MTKDVKERMGLLCGATNYSLALRNSEHTARYALVLHKYVVCTKTQWRRSFSKLGLKLLLLAISSRFLSAEVGANIISSFIRLGMH